MGSPAVPSWPWAISTLLAQIYSAPFLAYGLGSLYAATQRGWGEIRIAVLGTLVFSVGVLVGSWLHLGLFQLGSLSAWAWFGGFALASLALLLLAAMPAGRQA